MSRPEWTWLAVGVWWCKGCGCVKIHKPGKADRYKVPRRETERRKAKRYDEREIDLSTLCTCHAPEAPKCKVHQ